MLFSTTSLYFLSSLALCSAFAVVFQGEVSTFNALRNADSGGNVVVATIYSTCVWYDVNSEVIGTGPLCVSTLINYMLQAMASAAESRRPNASLAQHVPDLHVTHFTRSAVHPLDGAAAHLNVFGHDSALIVHTNGSHAYAAFEDVPAFQRATFQENDSWDYEVCDTSEQPLFYGKIVAEANRPGSDYEDAKPIGCKTVA
ncbi:hypothetical protein Q7P35_005196 [Cladosporium inversicolor]